MHEAYKRHILGLIPFFRSSIRDIKGIIKDLYRLVRPQKPKPKILLIASPLHSPQYREDDNNYQILWVSVADGSYRVLKTMEKGFSQTLQDCISHSPDDRYLAFDFPVEKDAGNYDINLISTDGSGELPLIVHPANDKLLGWVPEKEEILFLSDRAGTWDAFVVGVKNGRPDGSPKKVQ